MSEDSRTIYVGNISDRVSEEILYELFLQAGPLEKVTIPKDKEGRRRKFGFVTFKHDVSVPYTLQLFEGLSLYGRSLNLKSRNGGQDSGSPSHVQSMSPGMSPPVSNPNQPNAFSPRLTQAYGAPQPGQFHRSHTWHGNLPGEGISGERQYHRQQGSQSPEQYHQGLPSWSRQNPQQGRSVQQQQGQAGWFNQGSPMLPPSNMQQSNEVRRQRLLRQQQPWLDAHCQQHASRHQNFGANPWQQQSKRYGQY
ncbi:LOW QUALITY PROTEIN: RNA-binding protein 7-like [Liolophura sinensis]|uniref:LOW QUALITY PROTEIN: RNA-binding protein 7-like n=1 Tax=Liolophura sinensis TaxID=3198878 RepID=UPI0031587BAB